MNIKNHKKDTNKVIMTRRNGEKGNVTINTKSHNNETNKAIMIKKIIKKVMTMSIKNHNQKTNKVIATKRNRKGDNDEC